MKKKISEIDYDSEIRITDFEQFFGVHEKDGNFVYNLNETVYLNIDESNLLTYELKTSAHWPLVSYNLYNTTRLAWLLMKINKVDTLGSFRHMEPGTKIKYISKENVQNIIRGLD